MLCNVGVLNIYVGLGPCVYHAYPWHIMMSNSLKSSSFRFWGLPQDFNLHNPYNRRSTGHLASNMKEYPEINPNNFTETLILYNSSLPHFPYVACYPYDPDLHYAHMMYPPVGEPSFSHCAWQISSSLRNKIEKWSQYIWALYQAWCWYVHQIQLDIHHSSFSDPHFALEELYPSHQDQAHVQEPSALVGFCHVIYEMQGWYIYAMHHVVDKIAKDAGMASFQHGVDENLVGSTFIHAHQHPILDVLGEHGVPVFIINLCNVCKVVDKKKVNQPYKEEQEEAYSQIVGKHGAVVEITFVHVPIFFTIWPKPWIINRQRKDFEPDQVNCRTSVWVLAHILGLFDHHLPSSELVLKMIWTVFRIGDVEEIIKQPITRMAMDLVTNPQLSTDASDDDDNWGDNDTPPQRFGQFPHEHDDAFLRHVQMEEQREQEAQDHPVGQVYVACAYLGSRKAEKLIADIRRPPKKKNKVGLALSEWETMICLYLDDSYRTLLWWRGLPGEEQESLIRWALGLLQEADPEYIQDDLPDEVAAPLLPRLDCGEPVQC